VQQRERIFRIAAIAWLVTAIVRIVFAVTGTGPPDRSLSMAGYLVGALLGIAVAALLWLRPTRGSAIVACALGLYAVVGLAYAPMIGLQTWFVVLSATGIVAFVASVVAFFASRPSSGSGA
jgi:Na+/proline symporter